MLWTLWNKIRVFFGFKRKLRGQWTHEPVDDLQCLYGIDVESELIDTLSEEIMSDQSRMAMLYVDTESPFVSFGTKRAIGRPDLLFDPYSTSFEVVDIEDYLTNLREYYQEQVDNIPEMRQTVSYPEEHKLAIIDVLFGLRNFGCSLTPPGIMRIFMYENKGLCNPGMVKEFIEELVNGAMRHIKEVDYRLK